MAMTQGVIVGVLLMGLVGLIWVMVLDILGGSDHHPRDNRQGNLSPEPHDGEEQHGRDVGRRAAARRMPAAGFRRGPDAQNPQPGGQVIQRCDGDFRGCACK